jgi:excisionase family DNA binding protein
MLMTIKETAAYLHVSESFVYRLTAAGTIRCYRVGGAVRISEEQVIEWLDAHESRPVGSPPRTLCAAS